LYLGEFATGVRRISLLRSIGQLMAALFGWMLFWCAIDRIVHLPSTIRVILLSASAGTAGWVVFRSLLRWHRRPDWVAIAAGAERADDRFAQKLITVTSQALARPNHRGSGEILDRLATEVTDLLNDGSRRRGTLGIGRAAVPWVACLTLGALAIVLLCLPGSRFRELAIRFIAPMADVPAVTTTQLDVTPGNVDVVQSQPVTIEVAAKRLGDASVTVLLSDNDREWSAATMTPTGGGTFAFTVQAVDRDLRYYVTGGDARSREYAVRVLRRPAVTRFNIRYAYPSYSRLATANASNEDGRIEAPVGTRVSLTIVATEPLRDAWLTLDGTRVLTHPTSDPDSRQAEIGIANSGSYSVEMISTRGAGGSGPAGSAIRALPDLPPQVRLLRGGESLSQSPHEIVPIAYEAMDDYAIQSLTLRSQLNGKPLEPAAVKLWGDPRRQQEVYTYDLANIPDIHVGDVLTLNLAATDTGGHEVVSQPLEVLVSPMTVDLGTYQRLTELGRASQISRSLAEALIEANHAQEQMLARNDRRSNAYLSLAARADRALSGASQTATMLRQSLLKAINHIGDSVALPALAAWVDEAEVESATAQEAFRQSGMPGGMDNADRKALGDAANRAGRLADSIEIVSRGERADALIKDLDNLSAAEKRTDGPSRSEPKSQAQTLDRMHQEIATEAGQIGIDISSPEALAKLRELSRAEILTVTSTREVDFPSAIARWGEMLRVNPARRLGMDARLSAAAQAEAIRSDADLVRARDLEFAARAATEVSAAVRGGQRGAADLLRANVQDAGTVLAGAPQPTKLHPPGTQPAKLVKLNAARAELVRLAGGAAGSLPATRQASPESEAQRELEDLAMQANAAAASRQYQQASALEDALTRRSRARPRRDRWPGAGTGHGGAEAEAGSDRAERHRLAAEREMASASQVDDLDQKQSQLAAHLTTADSAAGSLAEQQRSVAEQIAGIRGRNDRSSNGEYDQPNSRERATTEVLAAIEQLATMPQALAEAQALAGARRDAAGRVEAARAGVKAAGTAQQDAAIRAVAEAVTGEADAGKRLSDASRPLLASVARAMAVRLSAFAPESDGARNAVVTELTPALESLGTALNGEDEDAVDRAAADTRQAIQGTQRELASARDLLMKRDPLAAARWFARAAAESLSASPPDVGGARRHQAGVFESLSRAWDQSIHRAAAERLAVVPSLAGVLGPPSPNARGGQGSGRSGLLANNQQWDRFRDDVPGLDSAMHDPEPPGYEQPLKLYFEALGRAGEGK
jgi:hypothetical protein